MMWTIHFNCHARLAVESALQLRAWIEEGHDRSVYEEFVIALFESLNACFKDSSNSLKTKKNTCGDPFIYCKPHLILKHDGIASSLREHPSSQL